MVCCSISSNGCEVKNPRVALPCCLAAMGILLCTVYMTPLILDYRRAERYEPTTCHIMDWEVKQRDCSIQVCTSASPVTGTQSCSTLNTVCNTCRYTMMAATLDGTLIEAISDFDGDHRTQPAAEAACTAAQSRSPITCWYQPGQNRDNRLYISLAPPTPNTSHIPVVLFGAIFAIFCIASVYCECATAEPDDRIARALALARARAWERESRAVRWQDYYGFEGLGMPEEDTTMTMNTNAAMNAGAGSGAGGLQQRAGRASGSSSSGGNAMITNPLHAGGGGGGGGGGGVQYGGAMDALRSTTAS